MGGQPKSKAVRNQFRTALRLADRLCGRMADACAVYGSAILHIVEFFMSKAYMYLSSAHIDP